MTGLIEFNEIKGPLDVLFALALISGTAKPQLSGPANHPTIASFTQGRPPMRMRLAFVAVLLGVVAIMAAQTKDAWAGCPPGTSYQCSQGFNGKVICGCR